MADGSSSSNALFGETKKLTYDMLMKDTKDLIELWMAAYTDYSVIRSWFRKHYKYLKFLRRLQRPEIAYAIYEIFTFQITLRDCIEEMKTCASEIFSEMEKLVNLLYSKDGYNEMFQWMECVTDTQIKHYNLKIKFPKFWNAFECFIGHAKVIENDYMWSVSSLF